MLQIEGYVVASDDDRLADRSGAKPDSLHNDAEWDFFQNGLDSACVTALGRKSHETAPNVKGRRRLVLTRSVERVVMDGKTVFWNPDGISFSDALRGFDIQVRRVAVAGGKHVFDHFLTGPHRFTAFHLSRVHGTQLPGGVGVFSGVEDGRSAEDILTDHGYVAGASVDLDDRVDVVTWFPG